MLIGLLFGTYQHPLRSLSELAGIAVGMALGVYGLRLTKFERTAQGEYFYTPSAHIGIALSLLFIGRLAYKLIHAYLTTSRLHRTAIGHRQEPFDAADRRHTGGYYATYAFGLLRWRRSAVARADETDAVGAAPPGTADR